MSCCKDQGNEEVVGAMKMRARMYYHIFCELRDEIGEEHATEIMKKGIIKGGKDSSVHFTDFAPDNLEGLKKAFLDWIPGDGSMFDPEVVKCDDEDLVIQFHACPLKDAYEEMGLDDEEKEKILAIAAAIDGGLFGNAGFEFSSITWKPGQSGCCRLHIKPGK